ncbi:MAG: hypothetical protein RQ758_02270 [Methanomicrobiaceae archaeon]|nr:hypothetical protein [Methanomicrobiaceae archaeon]
MGFAEDSLNSYITRDLQKKFLPAEGWKIEKDPEWEGVSFDYQVSRRQRGKMVRYLTDVIIAKKITEAKAAKLKEKKDLLEKRGIDIAGVVLFVPTGADTAAVSDDFEVMEIKVLKVADDDILWWRKHPLH